MSQTHSPSKPPVEYPESGEPPVEREILAVESDTHANAARAAVETLRGHFGSAAYVSGQNLLRWVEDDPRESVSPDCYVVKGAASHERMTFDTWAEGARPSFVLEVTSTRTRRKDLGAKMSTYRDDLQVPEYFLFDPMREWQPEGLRGFRLVGGVYMPIAPDERGRVPSRELGLELLPDGPRLCFYVPGQAEPLLTPAERAVRERDAAQAEVARLKAELETLRRGGG